MNNFFYFGDNVEKEMVWSHMNSFTELYKDHKKEILC